MEQIDDKKIAMSMLRCCAWLWEHCTKNPNEGEFKLHEVVKGVSGRKVNESATGIVTVNVNKCKCWNLFGTKHYPVDGVTFDPKYMDVTLEFGTFKCRFHLDSHLFDLTNQFFRTACPNMRDKVRFWNKDGERGVTIAEQRQVKRPKAKPAINNRTKLAQTAEHLLTVSERLRAAIMTRMASAA